MTIIISYLVPIFLFAVVPIAIIWYVWKKTEMPRRKKWFMTALVAAVILIILNTIAVPEENATEVSNNNQEEITRIKRVIDGDTVELVDGRRVRYIGIDTPEFDYEMGNHECFAEEANKENEKLIGNREVRLEKDISETDKYERLLRYIYIDDIFVNEYLVEQGFAKAMHIKPDTKYYSQFKQKEEEAKENKKGMWEDGVCD